MSWTLDISTEEVGIGKYGGLQPSFARVTESSEDESGFYGNYKQNSDSHIDRY